MNYVDEVTPDTVVATCVCDVGYVGFALEREFQNILLPTRRGIYRINGIEPVIPATEKCYVRENTAFGEQLVEIAFDDLGKCKQAIYNKQGKMLLHNLEMARKAHMLSLEPTLPVRGLKLLRDYIDFVISRESRWAKSDYAEQRLYRNNINTNADVSNLLDELNHTLRSLQRTVYDFIDGGEWNHYRVTINYTDLVIDKCGDYRICEWYRMQRPKDSEYE